MAHAPIHLTLLDDQSIQYVRSKVESGAYASESEVIREALTLLRQEETELEAWLKNVGGPIYDRMKLDPSSALSAETVERNLEQRRRQRQTA